MYVPFAVMLCDETSTPPVSHRVVDDAANGPQRWNVRVPLTADPRHRDLGLILDLDRGVGRVGRDIEPTGRDRGVADWTGFVSVVEVHSPSVPRAKSNSVAVSDCEERVSARNVLKHLPPRPLS